MKCWSCGHHNGEQVQRCSTCDTRLDTQIESINAITLITTNMTSAVNFYQSLGFNLQYGGESNTFTSFRIQHGHINLMSRPDNKEIPFWGRVILYVSDVDAMYARALAAGLQPEDPPRNADWGERYFHLSDPDGHQISFASPIDTQHLE